MIFTGVLILFNLIRVCMKSNTKYVLDDKKIMTLFTQGGIKDISNISPLGNGEFNSVYAGDADGNSYALKIAPAEDAAILTYEKNMMEQEVFYYSQMQKAGIRVPEIYYSDFSCQIIDTPYFIMERLEGTQLDQTVLSDEQRREADSQLASMAASMHSIRGEKFGYRQNGLHDNWYRALKSMVENLIADCIQLGRTSSAARTLLGYIDRNKRILEKVECCLINFDIWPANILCKKREQEIELFWIDPERCLWGDRISDFVCLDFNRMSLGSKSEIISYYNAAADHKITGSREEEIRYSIMLAYLGVIMDVEKYARYSLLHFGYWRNVSVCSKIFRKSFSQLKCLSLTEGQNGRDT